MLIPTLVSLKSTDHPELRHFRPHKSEKNMKYIKPHTNVLKILLGVTLLGVEGVSALTLYMLALADLGCTFFIGFDSLISFFIVLCQDFCFILLNLSILLFPKNLRSYK